MRLKSLHIKHENYYSDKPTGDKYEARVEFFNEKGEALAIRLREEQIEGIVQLCSSGITSAATEAAKSIVASLSPHLQIEQAEANRGKE